MPKELARLLAEAQQGHIDRREFIGRAAKFLGSVVVATTLFDSTVGARAEGAVVSPDDPQLESGWVEAPAQDYKAFFYQSKPKSGGAFPGVLVMSENRGVEDHIQDIVRRFAKEGYVAAAPDTISRFGGIQELGKDAAAGMVSGMRWDIVMDVVNVTFNHLRNSKQVTPGRIGIVGFCWGGAASLMAATQIPDLAACVVFYGRNPNPLSLVEKLKAPVLGLYGGLDTGITSKVPELKEAMEKQGKSFEYQVYDGAEHAFHNDTRPGRHHPAAAIDAWKKTLAFFGKHLKKA
jgi:carboxymethylenebutenolidase